MLYHLHTREDFASRNVILFENTFPFHCPSKSNTTSPTISLPSSNPDTYLPPQNFTPTINPDPEPGPIHITPPASPQPLHTTEPPTSSPNTLSPQISAASDTELTSATELAITAHHDLAPNQLPLRHSNRMRQQPAYLRDYHCNFSLANSTNVSSSKHSTCLYPLDSVFSYDKCSPTYKTFCPAVHSISET